jgi:hypothetical protein
MDSLSIGTIMHLFKILPDGPTKQFIQSEWHNHREYEDRDLETSLRMAMTRAFSMERHMDPMVNAWRIRDASLLALFRPKPCGHCQGPVVHSYCWKAVDYCSNKCRHDAGDRNHCERGCGCTGFAIKRRQLRNHRRTMRIMMRVIGQFDLWDDLDEELMKGLGNLGASVGLEHDHELDEDSDAEDPMVTQANELSNIDSIVQLSHNMVELAGVRRDLKRARDSD